MASRVIPVVRFAERTTVGMVLLKVRQTVSDLSAIFDEMFKRAPGPGAERKGVLEGAEDEIDKLFGN